MDREGVAALRDRLARPRWAEPVGWWGSPWAVAKPRSIEELVAGRVLSQMDAAGLQEWVRAGRSLVILAEPSGVGKSTLLDALIPSLGESRVRYYPAGFHDDFAACDGMDRGTLTILVNEISPHLSHYCWGDALRRLIELGKEGAQILATSHGASAAAWADGIARECAVDRCDLRCFGRAILLEPASADGLGRIVRQEPIMIGNARSDE